LQDPKCPFDALLEVIKDQIEIEEIVPENLDVGVEELARIAQRVLQKDDGSRTGTIVSVDFDLQDGTLVSAGDRFMEEFVIDNPNPNLPVTQAITRSFAGTFKSSFTKTDGWSFTGSADFKVPVFGGSVGMSMSATTTHSFSNSTEMSQTITRSNRWTITVPARISQSGKIMWQSWKADVPYTMVLRNSLGKEFTVHGIWDGVLAGESFVKTYECEVAPGVAPTVAPTPAPTVAPTVAPTPAAARLCNPAAGDRCCNPREGQFCSGPAGDVPCPDCKTISCACP